MCRFHAVIQREAEPCGLRRRFLWVGPADGEVQRAAHYEGLKLPADLDYMQVTALSIEARQKLARHRPETLGMAGRISGITPAAISLLLVHLKKKARPAATRLPGDVPDAA